MSKTKVCTKCKKRKPISQFYRRGDTLHGFFSHCKLCFVSYQKKLNQKAKEKTALFPLEKEIAVRKSLKNTLNLGKISPQDRKRLPQFGKFWNNAPMKFLFPKGTPNVSTSKRFARRIINS